MATIEELIFRVSADTKRMGNPLAPFQADIDQTKRDLEGLQAEMDQLDGESIDVDVKTTAIKLARSEIARLRAEVADAFVIDPTVDTRRAERTIRALQTKIKALTEPVVKAPEPETDPMLVKLQELAARSGIQVVSFLGRAISNAGSTGGPIIAGAIAGVIIAGISMAGGIIAASGGFAGLTLGIAGALSDPAIKMAASETVSEIKGSFLSLGDGLKGPVLGALEQINAATKQLAINLGPEFDRLGGVIDLFGTKVSEMINELGPGMASALRAAGPVLTEIAAALPALGANLSAFFIMLDANSEGAALSMKLLLITMQAFIATFTMTIGQVLTWFTMLAKGIDLVGTSLRKLDSETAKSVTMLAPILNLALWLTKAGDAAGESAEDIDKVAEANRKAAEEAAKAEVDHAKLAAAFEKIQQEAQAAAESLAAFFGQMFGALSNLDRAVISVEDGWVKLNDALEDGERTLALNTQAGRDNRGAILDQVDALKQARESRVALGESILDANQGFVEGIDLIRQNAIALGFNAKEVDALIKKYEDLPAQQIVEIQTEWATAKNPDVVYAELVKKFGLPVVQKILAEVDLESTRLAKEFFGAAFGDPIQERVFAKIDPEGFEKMKADIAAVGQTPTQATVNISVVEDASFGRINAQIKEWDNVKPSPSIVPAIEPEAYGAVLTTLFDLQKARSVPIVPYVDQNALEAVRITLNSLASASIVRPSTQGGDIDRTRPGIQAVAPPVNVRPRIYIDGNEIRAVIRGEVNQSVSGSTVAPTRYRRL